MKIFAKKEINLMGTEYLGEGAISINEIAGSSHAEAKLLKPVESVLTGI